VNNRLKLVTVDRSNRFLVEEFCASAKSSLETFRYFDNRPIDIIDNHLVTYILMFSEKPVAYGHLDPEGNKVWLGVCVAEGHRGHGYGKRMMNALITYANTNHLTDIDLSVDKDNKIAIAMYNQMGFTHVQKNDKSYFMRLKLIEER
jgi:RimJ/RimL family protein N-acetyltransferase